MFSTYCWTVPLLPSQGRPHPSRRPILRTLYILYCYALIHQAQYVILSPLLVDIAHYVIVAHVCPCSIYLIKTQQTNWHTVAHAHKIVTQGFPFKKSVFSSLLRHILSLLFYLCFHRLSNCASDQKILTFRIFRLPLEALSPINYSLLCHLELLTQALSETDRLTVTMKALTTGHRRWNLSIWPLNNDFYSTSLEVVWFFWKRVSDSGVSHRLP